MNISKRKLLGMFFISLCVSISLYTFSKYRGMDAASTFYKFILLALVIWCVNIAVRESYLINPYWAFAIVPLSLFLYDVNVSSHYLVKLTPRTYNFAISNIAAVILGMGLGKRMRFRYKSSWWGSFTNAEMGNDSKNAFRLICIGMIPYLLTIIMGFSAFVGRDMNTLKRVFGGIPLASVLNLCFYPGLLFAFRSKKRSTLFWGMFCFLLSVYINFSKTAVVLWSVIFIILIYENSIASNKKRRRFWIGLIIIALIIYGSFDFYNNIRFDYNLNNYFMEQNYVGNISSGWFLPYMYIISPWSNVQYIMDTISSHTYGLWLMKPFLGYLQLDNFFSKQYELIPRFSAFNTYTYMSVFYIDFGVIGSAICSFFLGVFMIYIYRLYKRYGSSPIIKSVYALNIYAMIMLFFNNHYLQQSYPITILIIALLWNKIGKKS